MQDLGDAKQRIIIETGSPSFTPTEVLVELPDLLVLDGIFVARSAAQWTLDAPQEGFPSLCDLDVGRAVLAGNLGRARLAAQLVHHQSRPPLRSPPLRSHSTSSPSAIALPPQPVLAMVRNDRGARYEDSARFIDTS